MENRLHLAMIAGRMGDWHHAAYWVGEALNDLLHRDTTKGRDFALKMAMVRALGHCNRLAAGQ